MDDAVQWHVRRALLLSQLTVSALPSRVEQAEPEAPAICPTPTELSVASACSAEPVDSSACCVSVWQACPLATQL